ncbi:MAG TPA: transposase [Candidatus Margulisiibacteriota bacterium]|jgi:transposase|nr:transposase [Candidatus Margulisiibacteriota bacterium]HVP52419.1 transposase [Terriglobales bacterium]
MDTSSQAVIGTPSSATEPAQKRQRWGVKQKRQIVEETLAVGASVARVAGVHGINANQVFYWRKQYRAGRLGNSTGALKLLPVTVEASLPPSAPLPIAPSGAIHIKLGYAHIRIEGSADPVLLRTILESLRG